MCVYVTSFIAFGSLCLSLCVFYILDILLVCVLLLVVCYMLALWCWFLPKYLLVCKLCIPQMSDFLLYVFLTIIQRYWDCEFLIMGSCFSACISPLVAFDVLIWWNPHYDDVFSLDDALMDVLLILDDDVLLCICIFLGCNGTKRICLYDEVLLFISSYHFRDL